MPPPPTVPEPPFRPSAASVGGGGAAAAGGRLDRNIVHFGRLLRAAGIPVGSGQLLDGLRAAAAVDVARTGELYWALHAAFVTDHRRTALFREIFVSYWRDPMGPEAALAALLPPARVGGREDARTRSRRAAEAWAQRAPGREAQARSEGESHELDAVMTWSEVESFRTRDFEQMSAEEIRRARTLIEALPLRLAAEPTRRFRPAPSGRRIDPRRSLRAALRAGGPTLPLLRRERAKRPPPLVALCDISGSMDRYARVLLHFLHTLTGARERVETFVFGTRLTRITHELRQRDVDVALAQVGQRVEDWSGGTRIGAALSTFNRDWSRRVLAQGAVVLLITDGLDREGGESLAREAERLHRSCRRFIWLNPLLRFEGFEPKAAGVRALLPHVDEHRPVHDLASVEELVGALGGAVRRGV